MRKQQGDFLKATKDPTTLAKLLLIIDWIRCHFITVTKLPDRTQGKELLWPMVSEVSLHGDGTQQSYSDHGRQETERIPGTLVILFPSQIYLGLQQRGWGVPHEWEVFLSGDTFTVTPRYVLPFSVLASLLPT